MKYALPLLAALLAFVAGLPSAAGADAGKATRFPGFRMQEIETGLGVGYAVLLVDVNGDGKPDIVVVDQTRVVWYENPSWKRRVIVEGMTRPDNVCIAAHDIDGDGKIDFALGADWKPFNTKQGGTLQWLKRGKTLDDRWTIFPIAHEPTLHRIRFADLHGDGQPRLLVAPLMGQNSTKDNNWMDGRPVRLLAYKIPKDPTRDPWVAEVLDDKHLHVVHNFHPIPKDLRRRSANSTGKAPRGKTKQMSVLTASYEGVGLLSPGLDKKREIVWQYERIGAGNQDQPKKNRGASEIKLGKLKDGRSLIATIEPWHGNQVVVYTESADPRKLWNRRVIDDKLLWGHAVWFADLDGDGNDQMIVGVRDNLSGKAGEQRGVRIYKALDDTGAKWARHIVDDGGVAVEDLAAADLNGDGRIDIVAVGRQTHNIRIYWNEAVK